ncbi:MAG: hypothetical protein Fur0012_02720 [Elusimicrobiota bacterium]
MSNKGKKNVICPHCKKNFEADFWTVVRGDLDFELKEMIINGEFDLLLCPECGKIFSYEDTFVYLDPGCEIMAFVLPEKERGGQMIEKVMADYDMIKGSATREGALAFKPYYFFGADDLAQLLLNDRDIEEETEVMEFMASEEGYSKKEIRKSLAREKDLLFSLPYEGANCTISSAISACVGILSKNDRLKRLSKLADFLHSLKEEEFTSIFRK